MIEENRLEDFCAPAKRGRGRPEGANSFVTVSLDTLTKTFANPTQGIVISKKWAQLIGLSGITGTSKSVFTVATGPVEEPEQKIKPLIIDGDAD